MAPGEVLKAACGTPEYVAPEILHQTGYGTPCDVWAMGVALFIMLCGRPPFWASGTGDERQQKMFAMIREKPLFFDPRHGWDKISEAAKDIIRQMLKKDPDTRITAAGALEHTWITNEQNSAAVPAVSQENLNQYQMERQST